MSSPRGRPISRPERRACRTFLEIDRLRRAALELAKQELPPAAGRETVASRGQVGVLFQHDRGRSPTPDERWPPTPPLRWWGPIGACENLARKLEVPRERLISPRLSIPPHEGVPWRDTYSVSEMSKLDKLLQRVPPELRGPFRSIVGRHCRCILRPLRHPFPPEKARELAALVSDLQEMPNRERWSRKGGAKLDRIMELRAQKYGLSIAHRIDHDLEDGLGAAGVQVLVRNATPAYLRGLWRVLDQWGADRLGVTLATFRSWRTKLRKSGDLSTPGPPAQEKPVETYTAPDGTRIALPGSTAPAAAAKRRLRR
jgi:hypothetical protein